jgi:hypothetical protein
MQDTIAKLMHYRASVGGDNLPAKNFDLITARLQILF